MAQCAYSFFFFSYAFFKCVWQGGTKGPNIRIHDQNILEPPGDPHINCQYCLFCFGPYGAGATLGCTALDNRANHSAQINNHSQHH